MDEQARPTEIEQKELPAPADRSQNPSLDVFWLGGKGLEAGERQYIGADECCAGQSVVKALGQRLDLGELRHLFECRGVPSRPGLSSRLTEGPSQGPRRQGRYRDMSRMRRRSLRALLVMAVLAGTLLPATAAFAAYSD